MNGDDLSDGPIPQAPHRVRGTPRTREAIRARLAELDVEREALLDALPLAGSGWRRNPFPDPPRRPGRPPAPAGDEDWMMLRRYAAGETFRSLGEKFGVTHEAIRLRLKSRFGDGVFGLVRGLRKARSRTRQAAKEHRRYVARQHRCPVCGRETTRRGYYCSERCSEIRMVLRHAIDDALAERHRYVQARWALEHSDDATARRSASRVLDGTAERRGRWFNDASKALEYATLAYENGWPLFDELPAWAQYQVRTGRRLLPHGRTPETRECEACGAETTNHRFCSHECYRAHGIGT